MSIVCCTCHMVRGFVQSVVTFLFFARIRIVSVATGPVVIATVRITTVGVTAVRTVFIGRVGTAGFTCYLLNCIVDLRLDTGIVRNSLQKKTTKLILVY